MSDCNVWMHIFDKFTLGLWLFALSIQWLVTGFAWLLFGFAVFILLVMALVVIEQAIRK